MDTVKRRRRGFSATQIIVLGFVLVILAGAILLHLPISSAAGERTPFLSCLFTSVSATCVTGLVVLDTATHWSIFGQAVILFLIQIGGFGFMTMAVLISMMIRRRISPRECLVLANAYNLTSFEGIVPLIRRILLGTAIIEGAGAFLLSIRFIPLFGIGEGIWKSVFHAVSAFCNAGFDLMGSFSGKFSSVAFFAEDALVSGTLMLLIMLGGIGFVVWDDLIALIRKRRRLSVYTALVLSVSGFLWIFGAVAVALCEWNNPATLGGLSTGGKILASLFQSVTMRTAGFNTVDLTACGALTQTVFLFLMFVGGASGSTAGGVKVATIGIFFAALKDLALGKKNVTVFRRSVPFAELTRALTLICVQFSITVIAAAVLIGCGADVMPALFEAFSASGTVGLSLSLTPTLSVLSRITVMLLMYFGRVGILTVTAALYDQTRGTDCEMRYADAHFMIG